MLSSIKHLHEHNIVHRDLKPENFLMETKDLNSEVKLIDFGLSKRWNTSEGADKMHTVVGTPYYVAPEVLDKKPSAKSDMWSLGCILYTMLTTGLPPFNGRDDAEIIAKIR